MAETYTPSVLAGLASGIALVIIFSIIPFAPPNFESKNVSIVIIPEGASLESNPPFLVPDVIKVKIGVNNTVRWVNQDSVPHGISTDSDYRDPYSGLFDVRERPEEEGGGFLMPRSDYEFTFTQPGHYPYHGEPHPWMQGTVIVLPP